MRLRLPGTIVAAAALFSAVPAHADVRVSIANGRVSVTATDATPRQILTEWARVGQTRVINAERLTGPPMSITLTNVPEAQALDTLLRSASGYVAAPRPGDLPNASRFDRIFILATSSVARPASAPVAGPPPAFSQPAIAPPGDQPPEEQPARQGQPPVPPNPALPRPPTFGTFPQPQPVQRGPAPVQAAPAMPSPVDPGQPATIAAPVVGVARPGMPAPTPQQPGQTQPGVTPG